MKFSTLVLIGIVGICVFSFGVSCGGGNKAEPQSFPDSAKKQKFEKIGEDTLKLIKEIKKYDSSDIAVGQISGLNAFGKSIYISDGQQNRVYVIDRETFKYKFTIGNGAGNEKGDLNKPLSPLILGSNIIIPQYIGPFLLSTFSAADGAFVKSLNRTSEQFGGYSSFPQGWFIKDSIMYVTKMLATQLKRVQLVKLYDSVAVITKDILNVGDFEPRSDSITMTKLPARLFIFPSTKQSKFYAVPGDKPLINSYSYDGKLLSSIDLRLIPELNLFYNNLTAFYGPVSATHFTSVASDDDNNFYFQAAEHFYMKQVVNKQMPLDSLKHMRSYVVAVNPDKLTYKVYHMDPKLDLTPLKVIGDQLWSYDLRRSSLVIHRINLR